MQKVSIVVPFFNESKIIGEKVAELKEFCDKHLTNYEVIFVNDGSSDDSAEKVSKFIKPHSNLHIISYRPNYGRGQAIRRGFQKAKGNVLGFIDCDLEIRPKYILEALSLIKKYDVIIASKYQSGSKVETLFARKLSSFAYNYLVRLFLGSKISDHQAGFKFFRKNVVDDLLSKTQEKGWLFDTEVLYLAQKKNYTIYELPISIRYGYRKIRGSFIQDFLKLPFVLVSLKKRIDQRVK